MGCPPPFCTSQAGAWLPVVTLSFSPLPPHALHAPLISHIFSPASALHYPTPQLPNFTSSLRPHAEGKLADRFQSHFDRYTGAGGNNVHYIAFDFHKECGTKRYHRMSVLWDQVRSVT